MIGMDYELINEYMNSGMRRTINAQVKRRAQLKSNIRKRRVKKTILQKNIKDDICDLQKEDFNYTLDLEPTMDTMMMMLATEDPLPPAQSSQASQTPLLLSNDFMADIYDDIADDILSCTFSNFQIYTNHEQEIKRRLESIGEAIKNDQCRDNKNLLFQCKDIFETILYIMEHCNPFKDKLNAIYRKNPVYHHNHHCVNARKNNKGHNDDNDDDDDDDEKEQNILDKMLHIQNLMRYFIANADHIINTTNNGLEETTNNGYSDNNAIISPKKPQVYCNINMIMKYSDMSKLSYREIYMTYDYGKYASVELKVKVENRRVIEKLAKRICSQSQTTFVEMMNMLQKPDQPQQQSENSSSILYSFSYISKAIELLQDVTNKII